jgi:hypothetical protein
MVGVMITIIPDAGPAVEEEEFVCPLCCEDDSINDDLRQEAIEEHNYRPCNESVAFRNDECCASCAFYDDSEEMQECVKDESMGYCVALKFVCKGENTCDMWRDEYKMDTM